MDLYLVRHGHAVSERADSGRPLSGRGQGEVLAAGNHLKSAGVQVREIWHSPKLRAVQTARAIAEVLGSADLCREVSGLKPEDPVEDTLDKIGEFHEDFPGAGLMIVSHIPFLPRLTGMLTAGLCGAQPVTFAEAAVVCLENAETAKRFRIRWAWAPSLNT